MQKPTIFLTTWALLVFGCSHKPKEIHGKIGEPVKLEGKFDKALPDTKVQTINYMLEVTIKDAHVTRQINQGFRKGYIAHEDNRFLLTRVSFNNLSTNPFEIDSVFNNFSIISDKKDKVPNWKKSIHAEGLIQGTNVLKLSPILRPKKQAEYWVIFMIPEDVLEDELYIEYACQRTSEEYQLIFRIKIKNSGSYDEDKDKYASLNWG